MMSDVTGKYQGTPSVSAETAMPEPSEVPFEANAKTAPSTQSPAPARESPHPDPTRYGDWEVRGRCIDF